jgi:hypothetical protein
MTELMDARSNSASLPTKCLDGGEDPFGLNAPYVPGGEAPR